MVYSLLPKPAAVACVYALILGLVVYKEYKIKDLKKMFFESLLQSCKTLFIIAIANFLAYFLMHQKIPDQVIMGMTTITTNPILLMLIIIAVLVVLGCFIEGIAVILITTPIFLPIITSIGVDLVQFGVIMILASMIGLLTPPVGMSLYAVSSNSKVDLASLSKEVIPYVVGIFVILLLVAFWSPLSMFLPNLFA